jgi:hypothetical protein
MAIELLIFKKDTISLILLFLSSGFILKFILEVNSYIKFLIKKTLYLSKLKDVIIKSNSYEEYIANKN